MPGRGPDQPAGAVIDDHRQVAVPFAVRDLIDPDPPQPVQAVGARNEIGHDTGSRSRPPCATTPAAAQR